MRSKEGAMWDAKQSVLSNSTIHVNILENGTSLTYADVLRYWTERMDFRAFYISMLADTNFEAFFWEHPGVTAMNIKREYEFVLVDSPSLAKTVPNPSPFEEKFQTDRSNRGVIKFENIGRDAELIVPCSIAGRNNYAHLASFLRSAPEEQKHELFITTANALTKRINPHPMWLNTSGLGVAWLHIRLDSRPKYYSHIPYRNE